MYRVATRRAPGLGRAVLAPPRAARPNEPPSRPSGRDGDWFVLLFWAHMSTKSSAQTLRHTRRPGAPAALAQGFRDTWTHRRLTWYLVRADLKKHGADTVLGNVWWVLDPLLQLAVYTVMVSVIFRYNIEAYPLFAFAAILPWKWFSSSTNDAITSVVSRERIIKQVSFPKIVLPVASTVGGIVNFAFGMIPLLGLMVIFYPAHLSVTMLLIPAVAVVQFVFTLALAVALGSLNVFYRDVGNLFRHVLRIWFYLSPALYTADRIAEITTNHAIIGKLFALNPWAILFESYHDVIYYDRTPDWAQLGSLLLISIVVLCVAVVFFKRVEPAFAKVL